MALPLPTPLPALGHNGLTNGGTACVGRDLDKLVHRLNRKPILQDSLRWHFLDRDGDWEEEKEQKEEEETVMMREGSESRLLLERRQEGCHEGLVEGPNKRSRQMSTQLQPVAEFNPAPAPISEVVMQYEPYPPTIPPLCDSIQSYSSFRCDSLVVDAPSEDKSTHRIMDAKRPRRGTDTRLHKSASNLRMLQMIENGVQCNVQQHSSTPPSPIREKEREKERERERERAYSNLPYSHYSIPASMRHIEPQDTTMGPHIVPGRMQLEVDMGVGELDEETLFNDNLALRHAGTPSGISKFGLLRYRSSSEAAQACKNMKKSVPRMRRRRRTNQTGTSESSSSKPPSTVA